MEIRADRWAVLGGVLSEAKVAWPEEALPREEEDDYKQFRADLEKSAWLRGEDMEKFMSPKVIGAVKGVMKIMSPNEIESIKSELEDELKESVLSEDAKKAFKKFVEYVKKNPTLSYLAAGGAGTAMKYFLDLEVPEDVIKLFLLGLSLPTAKSIENFMGDEGGVEGKPVVRTTSPGNPRKDDPTMASYVPGQYKLRPQRRHNEMAYVPAELLEMIMEQATELDNLDDYVLEMVVEDVPNEVIEEAKKGKKLPPLGKVMKGDVKKFKVYVKDKKTGNVKKVNFGDPNMEIRRDNPKARKSFRARHGCGTPRASDRTKAAYWSCRMWSKKPVSKILRGE